MSGTPVYVGAAGMACPVGLSWPAACAAMRAGLSRKTVSPYCDDEGREIVASYLGGRIDPEATEVGRWSSLLAASLRDLARVGSVERLEKLQLFVALPASVEGRAPSPDAVAGALAGRAGLRIEPGNVHVICEGAYGGYVALQRGRAIVRGGQPCIVAASDSLLSAHRLLALSAGQRLLVEGNSDGVIPGEAAAAMLLTRNRRGALAGIRGVGFAEEPALLDNDVPLRAEGLVAATRAALHEGGERLDAIDFRVSDAAGESYFFKEQSLLVSRLLRVPKPEFPLWLPAETLGDTGAAAGLCGMLWAMAGWARRYAPGPRAIAFAGNDLGRRAAVVFEKVE